MIQLLRGTRSYQKRFFALLLMIPLFAGVSAQTLKIMALGNSLTHGIYCTNGSIYPSCLKIDNSLIVGYREVLYQRLKQEGYTFDFVGSERAGQLLIPDSEHAGYAGFTTDMLANKLNENNNFILNYHKPDLILLEIGTNDVWPGGTSVTGVNNILNEIQEYENSSGKKVLVLLSPIINFAQGEPNEQLVATFNSNLWNLYQTRIGQGDLIEWLPMGAGIDYRFESAGGDMKDELHPNQDGYDIIGQNWFGKIDSYNHTPSTLPLNDDSILLGGTFKTINLNNHISDYEDPDSEITWTVSPSPVFFNVSINAQKIATITPLNPNWTGSETINFVASDKGGMVNGYGLFTGFSKSVVISADFKVYKPNNPPSLVIPEDRETYVGDVFQLTLSATDPDAGDNPVISPVQLPAWLNYNSQSKTLYGTAASNNTGTNSVKMNVTDSKVTVDTTFYITVIPKSGLNEINGSHLKYNLYPNPTDGEITVEMSENKDGYPFFSLYSLTGYKIATIKLEPGNNRLDLNALGLNSGLYIYEISEDGYSERGKMMITEK